MVHFAESRFPPRGAPIPERLFRYLLDLEIEKANRLRYCVSLVCLTPDVDAVVPCPASGPIPVCAVYRASVLAEAERRIERRDLTTRAFVDALRARLVAGEDLESLDPDDRCLLNLNTPADYETALRLADE